MKQEINLLLQLPKPKTILFCTAHILQITTAWMLLLVIIYGLGWNAIGLKEKKLAKLLSKKESLQQKARQYNRYKTTLFANPDRVAAEKTLLETLAHKQKTQTTGFASTLLSLAQYTPCEIWFTRITISHNDITLTGEITAPHLIPKFLEDLQQYNQFKEKRFHLINLSQTEKNKPLSLNMSTKEQIQKGERE